MEINIGKNTSQLPVEVRKAIDDIAGTVLSLLKYCITIRIPFCIFILA